MAYILGANAFRALRKDINEIDPKLKTDLAKANKSVAKFVVSVARARAHSLGGVQGKSANAVTASGSGTAVAVFIKKTARPYAFGAEFGSKQFKQFGPWRGNPAVNAFEGGPGYFLFPSIRENRAEIEQMWVDSIEELLKQIKETYS